MKLSAKEIHSTHSQALAGMESVRYEISQEGFRQFKAAVDGGMETEVHGVLAKHPEILRDVMPDVGHHGMWFSNKPQIRPPLTNGKKGKIPDLLLAGKGSGGFAWFLVELKSPLTTLFNGSGNAFSKSANEGLNQLASYLHYAIEKQGAIRDALEIPDFTTPRGILIIGRESETFDDEVKGELKAFWNQILSTIQIVSYDRVLKLAEKLLKH
jgi:hypothetical protein